jgi:phage gpG-like protein
MHYQFDFQLGALKTGFAAAQLALLKPDRLLGSIGQALLQVNEARHRKGLAPDGTPWKPLAKSTMAGYMEANQHKYTFIRGKNVGARTNLKKRQEVRDAKRILYVHGDLLRFSYRVENGALWLGTVDHKAEWHHFGRKEPYTIKAAPGKALAFMGIVRKQVQHPGLPARPLVGFPAGDRQVVEDLTQEHLRDAILRGRL